MAEPTTPEAPSPRGEGLARGLAARASLAGMVPWLAHDGIGEARALEIALNVFVPFPGPEAWQAVAGTPPPRPLPGLLERREAPRVTTVRRYFGALRSLKRRV